MATKSKPRATSSMRPGSALRSPATTSSPAVPRLIADISTPRRGASSSTSPSTSFALARDGFGPVRRSRRRYLQRLLMDGGYVAEVVEILDAIAISRAKPRAPAGRGAVPKARHRQRRQSAPARSTASANDLYQRVLTGELWVMAAAVEADWRKVAREGGVKRVTAGSCRRSRRPADPSAPCARLPRSATRRRRRASSRRWSGLSLTCGACLYAEHSWRRCCRRGPVGARRHRRSADDRGLKR